MEIYNNPADYKGKEWDELLKEMDAKDIKRTWRSAYRRVGKLVAQPARDALASAIRHGSAMAKNIRVRVWPKGYGFSVTVKPHGKQGYYRRSQDGREKPVAMWAQEGTVERHERHGGKGVFKTADGFKTMKGNRTGKMKGYHFLEASEKQGPSIVEREMYPELEKETEKRLRKLGWI